MPQEGSMRQLSWWGPCAPRKCALAILVRALVPRTSVCKPRQNMVLEWYLQGVGDHLGARWGAGPPGTFRSPGSRAHRAHWGSPYMYVSCVTVRGRMGVVAQGRGHPLGQRGIEHHFGERMYCLVKTKEEWIREGDRGACT